MFLILLSTHEAFNVNNTSDLIILLDTINTVNDKNLRQRKIFKKFHLLHAPSKRLLRRDSFWWRAGLFTTVLLTAFLKLPDDFARIFLIEEKRFDLYETTRWAQFKTCYLILIYGFSFTPFLWSPCGYVWSFYIVEKTHMLDTTFLWSWLKNKIVH